MSNFKWNINFLVFWRLAWYRKLPKGCSRTEMVGWYSIGRLYVSTQDEWYRFIIEPKIKKIKNWIAKLDDNLL